MTTFLKKKNNAKSTLASDITDVATSLTVQSGDGSNFPASGNFRLTIWDSSTYSDPGDDPNMEIVEATLDSGDTFTITRAQEGTTGVAHSTGDAVRLLMTKEQVEELEDAINNPKPPSYAEDSGSTDAYAITLDPAPSAYEAGQVFYFKANTVNTGACTLNVNSLGAKTIKKQGDKDLADGDIKAGQRVVVIYDGTNMQMLSQVGNAGGGAEVLVHADGENSGGFALTGSYQDIVFKTEDKDVNGDYDNTTGVFTAPEDGVYQVDAFALIGNSASGSYALIMVNFNVSAAGEGGRFQKQYENHSGFGEYITLGGTAILELSQNDTVKIQARAIYDSGTIPSVVDDAQTRIRVTKIG